jgi:hypothetical protein
MFEKRFKKYTTEEANDYMGTIAMVEMLMIRYIRVWFEQLFLQPDWAETFKDNDCSLALAYSVTRTYLGSNMDEIPEGASTKFKKQLKQVAPHIQKWADDVITNGQEAEFAELVLQTVLMEGFLLENNTVVDSEFREKRGAEIVNVLGRYQSVPFNKDIAPKDYQKTLDKFILWQQNVARSLQEYGHLDWLTTDYNVK